MKSGKDLDLYESPDPPAPPPDLSDYAAWVWRRVITRPKKNISAGRLEALHLAFELLDDYRMLREAIYRESFFVRSARSGLPRRHPLLKDYLEIRKDLLRTWIQLGLHFDASIDGWVL